MLYLAMSAWTVQAIFHPTKTHFAKYAVMYKSLVILAKMSLS